MPLRPVYTLVTLLTLQFLACGADGMSVAEKKQALAQAEAGHERAAVQVPDSILAALSPVDTLFLGYDHPALRPVRVDTAAGNRWADSVLASLTLDEKIGQLFIVELPRRTLRGILDDDAVEAVREYNVGGFLVPRLLDPEAVFDRTQPLQRQARIPLFFAADYERGVGRFNNPFTELPSNMALGATRDTVFAAAAGRLSALESRAIGINLLFAPVVDVNNNPDNPIINIRSYGEDPELVGRMAGAYVREAEAHGVLTTLKHFPGHGNTSVDTHARMGVIRGSRLALRRTELRPYRMLFRQAHQPAGVMTAHLWVEALDERPLPATLSRRALTEVLREELGFEGFVVTDDVKMGALSRTYSLEERVIRPLFAGADIILTPADLGAAVRIIRAAVKDGRLQEVDIDRSVRRILRAKARIGLHRNRYADEAALEYLMSEPRGAYIAQSLAERSMTLLRSSPYLPIRSTQHVGLIQLSNYNESPSIDAAMAFFSESLGKAATEVRLDHEPTPQQASQTLEEIRDADVVVLALYLRLQQSRGEAGLRPAQERLVRGLLARNVPVVLVTFGNPYAVTTFSGADAFLVAYDQTLESARAAADVLSGRSRPQGRLPITVKPFAFGAGLDSLGAGLR